MVQFIIGLLKSRNVPFCEVTQHLNDVAKPALNKMRIQDFFRQATLDYLALLLLLVNLLLMLRTRFLVACSTVLSRF